MKRMHSRRHRALRWLLFLAVAVAAIQLCGIINFTPAAVRRELEREYGLEKTTPLAQVEYLTTPNIHNEGALLLRRYTVSAAGDMLLLSAAVYGNRTIGWEAEVYPSDVWKSGGGNPVEILWDTYHSAALVEGYFILFGRVADREVSELVFQVSYGDWGAWDESHGTKIESETFAVDEFVEWNGERVFLKLFETPESHRITRVEMVSPERQIILDN